MMMTHDIESSHTDTTLIQIQEFKFTCKFTGVDIHMQVHRSSNLHPNSQIHEDHKLSLLLLLVLIAGLAGSTLLLLVPIAGLSSGSIGVGVFFLVVFIFLLLFALTGAAVGAGSFESYVDLCMAGSNRYRANKD